ncbi:hypothetical protein [Pseudonocardia nigra]|uniref:hypothetical protein n=1 Tax=Pseudonocardia nigra TaxID=1921578 RepID=UPI001C5F8447|nr:hypothetical protein [Pseudonocardia nigra]
MWGGDGAPTLTHVSTRAMGRSADMHRRVPGRRTRLVIPARLRIMAWLVLLLLVALSTVVVVTRTCWWPRRRAMPVRP